jgi:hypothetical protein
LYARVELGAYQCIEICITCHSEKYSGTDQSVPVLVTVRMPISLSYRSPQGR